MSFTDVTTGARIILEGLGPIKITLSGDCKTGDLLGYSSGWKQADADNTIYPRLVAGETAENGEIITAYASARIGGITTGTAGADLFLSDTAGGYHHTASTTISQKVGFELGSGEMFACPKDFIEFRAGSTLPALTLGGAIAAGDVSWTGVGNMTFTKGSILASGDTADDTLILSASSVAFITLKAGTTDECELEDITMKGDWLVDGSVTLNTGAVDFKMITSGDLKGLELEGSNASNGPTLKFDHTDTTPTLNSICGAVGFHGFDGEGGSAVTMRYGEIRCDYSNVTSASEAGRFDFYLAAGGAADNLAMTLSGAGELWVDADIVLDTGQAINCGVTEDHYYDLEAYNVDGTAYVSAIRIQNANSATAPIEIGFFGKTPIYMRDHISDATGSAGTAINHIIDCLEEFGFAATS